MNAAKKLREIVALATVVVVVVGLSVAIPSTQARASQIAYEGFRQSFPLYANSGTGFAGPWTQGGFNAFASGYTARERSLCFKNLRAGEGGSVTGEAFSAINGAVRNLEQPLGASGTTAYLSFLIQPRGSLNEGVFNGFFGLTLNGSLGRDLFIGKPGGGTPEQYVLEERGGLGQVSSGVPTVVGRVTLLVVKAQFQAGADVFTLYVNPTPGQPEPGSNVVKTDVDLGAVSRIGIYSTGAFAIDEIRIGTTYADVVPTAGKKSHHDDDDDDNEARGCRNRQE